MDKCPICHRCFQDCEHTFTEAVERQASNNKAERISKLLKDLPDDAPITKKVLLAVIRKL